MRIHTALVSSLTLAALTVAGGQVVVSPRASTMRGSLMPSIAMRMENPRAVIGVTTSTSTGSRDTLGLLVSTVTRNSPAEKSGIEEGNRIASINGISLKLAAADIGDPDMESLMSRRLIRELDKVKPGDDVELHVYGGGQLRTMKVKTVDPDSLYSTRMSARRSFDDRPTLGLGIGSSGSKRDTLGVFVMSVDDAGPAAKAGIEEGQRIAAINGVDLRVARDDAGDDFVSEARVSRLERELGKVKPGDAVDLRVYSNGQTRNVKVTTVAMSALPGHGHSVTIIRDGNMIHRPFPPDGDGMELDGEMIGATVRRAIEKAQAVTGERLEDLGRVFDNMGRGLNGGGAVRWFDDEGPTAGQVARAKPAPAPRRRVGTTISM
jgi:C-terminal processing protease CtpA/Prc